MADQDEWRVVEVNGKPIVSPDAAPAQIGPEPSFAERALAAVGPTIRGVGDVTLINRALEAVGAVDPGRLTGDEKNARDASTRQTAGVGGLAMMAGGAGDAILQAAKSGGAKAAAMTAGSITLAPYLKFRVAKGILTAAGVPSGVAEALAIGAVGLTGRPYTKGSTAVEPVESPKPFANPNYGTGGAVVREPVPYVAPTRAVRPSSAPLPASAATGPAGTASIQGMTTAPPPAEPVMGFANPNYGTGAPPVVREPVPYTPRVAAPAPTPTAEDIRSVLKTPTDAEMKSDVAAKNMTAAQRKLYDTTIKALKAEGFSMEHIKAAIADAKENMDAEAMAMRIQALKGGK